VNCLAEISKIFYTKALGIDASFMKGMMPLFGSLLKESISREALLSAIKAFGVFVNQATITPVRTQQFYKDIIDQNYDVELCAILLKPGAKVGAIEVAVV
jgi:hypothetical protein